MSLAAAAADGYRSSADACGRGRYFWQKQKCLRPHISHLQRQASLTTAYAISRLSRDRAVQLSLNERLMKSWLACELQFSLQITGIIHESVFEWNFYCSYNLNLWSHIWGQMSYIHTAVFTSINCRCARDRMCSVSRVTQCS